MNRINTMQSNILDYKWRSFVWRNNHFLYRQSGSLRMALSACWMTKKVYLLWLQTRNKNCRVLKDVKKFMLSFSQNLLVYWLLMYGVSRWGAHYFISIDSKTTMFPFLNSLQTILTSILPRTFGHIIIEHLFPSAPDWYYLIFCQIYLWFVS